MFAELETLAKFRKVTVLHGRFAEVDRALPYHAFSEAIQEYFRTRQAFATPADFSDLGADLTLLFPALNELRDLVPSADAARALTENRIARFEGQSDIFELLARMLIRMAAGKPLILLLEELHLADVSTDALACIVRRLASTPILIVAAYRTTEIDKHDAIHRMISGFKGDPRFTHLELGPLPQSAHHALVQKLCSSGVPSAKVDPAMASILYESTEGNPYFTTELVKVLTDSCAIVQDHQGVYRFSKDGAFSADELPGTIQQTVQKRIQHLPKEQLDLLTTASILGKTFDFEDLKILLPDQTDLELNLNLEKLLTVGFLEDYRQSRGLCFTFSSGILRDVLYGSLPHVRRRILHRDYADALANMDIRCPEDVYSPLFEHYSRAFVPEKVIHYGFLLARKSLTFFSPYDTIRALRTVLDFLDYSGNENPLETDEAKLLLGAAQRMKGNSEESLGDLEERGHVSQQFELLQPKPEETFLQPELLGCRSI